MRVQLQWDNPEETIVRWDFVGWIGILDYIVAINETASMGIRNGGQADTILHMGMKLPFPNRHPRELIKPILASRFYGLGYIVIVTQNPVAVSIIRLMLGRVRTASSPDHAAIHIVGSLAAARQRIEQLRSSQNHDIKMKMR
ncbi:MAG: hypothetical protein SF162_18855 [bacterium]|nr:hypothetical protein [bacterium]